MTVYLIEDLDGNRYVANSSGIINFARNEYNIQVEDIDEVDNAISELSESGVDVQELDFDTEPLIPV